jgi:4-hydroxy 2-oxovalerate aldolase
MARIESKNPPKVRSEVVWLDCTFRDGGYYNAWDFPVSVVQEYLCAMNECGVDRVELGFRFPNKKKFLGFAAYTPDFLLDDLDIPPGLRIGVMVNASDLSESENSPETLLSRLFPPPSIENIDFVRIATHSEDLSLAISASRWLKSEGYEVGVNLMQVSESSMDELTSFAAALDPHAVDVLYVADSLGNLGPTEMSDIVHTICQVWESDIGVHAHDNGGLATANTLAAIEAGARWVDSTITGMGRGAGNTRSEILAGHMEEFRETPIQIERLEQLMSSFFLPLQAECGWGVNSHYVRAAMRRIHPTFVQELLANSAYSPLEIDAAISELGKGQSQRFSRQELSAATSWIGDVATDRGEWNQRELFEGRKVLLLGGGPSGKSHSHALTQLARKSAILVISTNLSSPIDPSLISAHVVCHPLRIVADAHSYSRLEKPIISPQALVPGVTRRQLQDKGHLLDVGLSVTAGGVISASEGLVELPAPLVLAYSLLICLSGGATDVLLAGFDGYSGDDPRRFSEQQIIEGILALRFPAHVVAITPTRYDMPQSSVYGMVE